MNKTAVNTRRFVILDSRATRHRPFVRDQVSVCRNKAEIERIYNENHAELTWISLTAKLTDSLALTVADRRNNDPRLGKRKGESLLTVQAPRVESRPMLQGLFARIVGDSPHYRWLPAEELLEVLVDSGDERPNLFIAVAADPVTKTLSLIRGDFCIVVVSFAIFEPSGDGIKPDFSNVAVTDYGRTVALGEYEASADAILYEVDLEYRKAIQRKRKESERSFGASLLRLRKQRKLKRSDFAPLPTKTIARLERNEVDKPRGKTLQILCERLGVTPDQIETY